MPCLVGAKNRLAGGPDSCCGKNGDVISGQSATAQQGSGDGDAGWGGGVGERDERRALRYLSFFLSFGGSYFMACLEKGAKTF